MVTYYHGGVAGLNVGDILQPSEPHVTDNCPICMARLHGIPVTVGDYRTWLRTKGAAARTILEGLEGAPDDVVIDPPTEKRAVYFTTDIEYATFYAARSGHGDIYEIEPIGPIEGSETDHFPSFTAPIARVTRVVRRRVYLDRRDRRRITRMWEKADKRVAREARLQPEATVAS